MKDALFLTAVVVTRNPRPDVVARLQALVSVLADALPDFDVLVIDNASDNGGAEQIASALTEARLANTLLLALAHPLSQESAELVGLENALGDLVVVVDLEQDPLALLPMMVAEAAKGADVVYAQASQRAADGWLMGGLSRAFHWLYERIHGVNLSREAPPLKMLSRRVVNHILSDDLSELALTHLPAVAGFQRATLSYEGQAPRRQVQAPLQRAERALRLLVASGPKPMRILSLTCFFGAGINVLYSIYVVAIFLFKTDVAPGWVTLSLQQSGMFFLISLVLLMLAEYVLIATRGGRTRMRYALKAEVASVDIKRRSRNSVIG